ncbi:TRAP transporter permease [Aestuariirhabdus sp. Z084]|uniref:TRAP transporter permease n=1 Tax=Aestuariirhabdus haliotis TaxID=2918751 RepID=UPI00201B45B3|nr:TRAP transporter permease [Aestuariirhabdus haliotis]MCL6417489.1 TRAP transporter permease [Aestuariirhabdus haliotis]MCL6421425.1 TRAP transporter permease [Aestuariirhabdus haliotis]
MTASKEATTTDDDLQQMIAESDSGSRMPKGLPGAMLLLVPILWSLFQLWYSSPLPFIFRFGVFNDTEARAVHLAFAIFLSYTAYPALTSSPRDYIPWQDWLFALVGCFCASYLYLFYTELANRSGAPTQLDLWVAAAGMVLLLEATRRALGPPLMVVATIFLIYTFAGAYMPDVIAHKGASFAKGMSHFWLTTEGVFGVALGVSTNFVFLFVLFGALLDRAGAGNYFIQVAFSLLGHYRGGPAKAAVVSSGLSGIISGSSIANVVTTGTFTIPLMKRVGFPATKAGAIEVAASTNGQLTPPIMGAAAFLMVEYVGISYIEVIKHAILPAGISYVALFYIVHLEAVKAGMQGLPRPFKPTLAQSLMNFFGTIFGLCVLTGIVYYGIGWTKDMFGSTATYVLGFAVLLAYIGLVRYAATVPELKADDPKSETLEMPPVGPTVKSGLYFLLPIVVLVWCLTVERFSPGLSAFWATIFMIFIVVSHRPLLALFRHEGQITQAVTNGFHDLVQGMASGARNMIGIGVATAAAGIVVGAVTLTGVGLVMTEFVEFISGGSVMLMLIFTAIISLILGMGLPTTANYIVVSTLMAPVIVALGAQNGLIVPLIAVHLFVFYFGILADDTPPVGLAAFAAAAIAQSDPIRTGIQGFIYDIRTAILPFMFIFNTQLLLIGVHTIFELVLTVVSALAAMLVFAIATQGFWFVRTRWYEVVPLLLIAFTLFRPGFWWEFPYPELASKPAHQIVEIAEQLPEEADIRLRVSGENLDGKQIEKIVMLPLGPKASGEERIAHTGMELLIEGDSVTIDAVDFGGPANKSGLDFDWQITEIQTPNERPPKQLMFIPALLLLAGVFLSQRRRYNKQQSALQHA